MKDRLNFTVKKYSYDISDQAEVYCNNDFVGNVISDKESSFYNAEVIYDVCNYRQYIGRGQNLDSGINWIVKQYVNSKNAQKNRSL